MLSWERSRLRKAATRYARERLAGPRPGAFLVGPARGPHSQRRRFDCGAARCPTVACHPTAHPSPSARPPWPPCGRSTRTRSCSPRGYASTSWRCRPPGPRGSPGRRFRGGPGPGGRGARRALMFLVLPGHGVLPELSAHPGVLLHGQDSWSRPAEPMFGGRVSWNSPGAARWKPARPYACRRSCWTPSAPDPWSRRAAAPRGCAASQ